MYPQFIKYSCSCVIIHFLFVCGGHIFLRAFLLVWFVCSAEEQTIPPAAKIPGRFSYRRGWIYAACWSETGTLIYVQFSVFITVTPLIPYLCCPLHVSIAVLDMVQNASTRTIFNSEATRYRGKIGIFFCPNIQCFNLQGKILWRTIAKFLSSSKLLSESEECTQWIHFVGPWLLPTCNNGRNIGCFFFLECRLNGCRNARVVISTNVSGTRLRYLMTSKKCDKASMVHFRINTLMSWTSFRLLKAIVEKLMNYLWTNY